MRSTIRGAVVAVAALAVPFGAAAQVTIGFEDLTTQRFVPTSYSGFDFTGGNGESSWVVNGGAVTDDVFQYGVVGEIGTWSNGGTWLEFSSASLFQFTSAFLGAGNPTCGTEGTWSQGVQGFQGQSLLYSVAVDITCGSASTHVFDWDNVDRVQFAGGVNLTVDDLQIDGGEVVPEPATMILLASGLLGLAVVARRRDREDGIGA